jgi:hypothetical protein
MRVVNTAGLLERTWKSPGTTVDKRGLSARPQKRYKVQVHIIGLDSSNYKDLGNHKKLGAWRSSSPKDVQQAASLKTHSHCALVRTTCLLPFLVNTKRRYLAVLANYSSHLLKSDMCLNLHLHPQSSHSTSTLALGLCLLFIALLSINQKTATLLKLRK